MTPQYTAKGTLLAASAKKAWLSADPEQPPAGPVGVGSGVGAAAAVDAAGAGGTQQREIEVAQRKQQPAKREMHAAAPPAPGQQALDVFDADYEQRGGGTGAPALGDNFEIPGQQLQPIECEPAIVLGIFVERVAEGRHQMQVAAGSENIEGRLWQRL